ncbi:hypothetical protein L6164_036104 [Bauhinia variegata]|uniref:Uncharacterized protein n=1 Tax=Bauhinia variegata TaxID=167791 RepID=A0ACB9KG41_BAUVA|nr:hypothetical protein L6164_036104 [Bauhinia variegata]
MAKGSGKESADNMLKLYSYWRSSCSYRVRIALHLKGLNYEYKAVDLLNGEHYEPEFLKLNPTGYVPVLVDDDIVVADSLAILMYLEEKYPQHPLLPHDIQKRAINFQAANIVSSSIQPPLLFIWNHIEEKLPLFNDVIVKGFTALEKLLKDCAGRYATGDEIFLADLFLAPQIQQAFTMYNIDMTEFPLLARLNEAYNENPAFQDTLPEKQPDAPSQVSSTVLNQ